MYQHPFLFFPSPEQHPIHSGGGGRTCPCCQCHSSLATRLTHGLLGLFAPQAFHLWGDGAGMISEVRARSWGARGDSCTSPVAWAQLLPGYHNSVSPGVRAAELALLQLPNIILGNSNWWQSGKREKPPNSLGTSLEN